MSDEGNYFGSKNIVTDLLRLAFCLYLSPMFIFNETVGIDKEAEDEWLAWMRDTHIPLVMQTGHFLDFQFFRIVTHDDPQSASYCVQYRAVSIEEIVTYLEQKAPLLNQELQARFKDKHVAFRTLLEAL